LPLRNVGLVPASEPHISNIAAQIAALVCRFGRRKFFRDREFYARRPAAEVLVGFFWAGILKMILDVIVALLLTLTANALSQSIRRRRDVFNYISRPRSIST
jgi:putative flippase GtrA